LARPKAASHHFEEIAMTATDQAAPAQASPLPLFYRAPEALSAITHAGWRIRSAGLGFAADSQVAPLVVAEFAKALRWYPIVFTAGASSPVALLGLDRRNLFVADGGWTAEMYVPAYVRRYPFGFMATSDADRFALAIDTASDAVVREGEEGEPLFIDGEPAPLTLEALKFCDAYREEAAATAAFCAALVEKDLLVDRRADVTTPDGRHFGLDGFKLVDRERLAALDADTVVDWHRRGWLGLVHFHLASLDRFSDLMVLQGRAPAL
jgi:hypothetical protein